MRNFGRSTPPASPGNIFVAIRTSSRIAGSSNEPPAGASWTKPRQMRLPGAGGCDFATAAETSSPNSVLWAATAAIRLWRGSAGRNPGPNPAELTKARRDRLILALRALDGRLADATYREIASALFTHPGVSGRGWKSHDLRDRTIRLVRLGLGMMRSGYRQLLLYPYRQRTSATQQLDTFLQ